MLLQADILKVRYKCREREKGDQRIQFSFSSCFASLSRYIKGENDNCTEREKRENILVFVTAIPLLTDTLKLRKINTEEMKV